MDYVRTTMLTAEELERINRVSTHQAQRVSDALAKAVLLAADGDKTKRLEAHECSRCWYLDSARIAGQAFTSWKCALCNKPDQWSNTAVPKLCRECADAYGLCVTCGGDIEMKLRTKFDRKARKKAKRAAL